MPVHLAVFFYVVFGVKKQQYSFYNKAEFDYEFLKKLQCKS